jgi:hypothetical protein
MSTTTSKRRALIEKRATLDGELWATETRARVATEQRLAAGGWPGTLSEARARVARLLMLTDSAEREHAARVLYASARTLWLKYRQPESE